MSSPSLKKIVILFAHPALYRSRVNKVLIEGAKTLESVTVQDLYFEYPDLNIDVEREQQLLVNHDIIAFQFPLYWYSSPAILKEWQDLVLEHGWAYGQNGGALKGKYFLPIITTGGSSVAYTHGGHNHFTMVEFLTPLRAMSNTCQMKFISPIVIHGTHLMTAADIEQSAQTYVNTLLKICDSKTDLDKLCTVDSTDFIIKDTK